MASVPKADSKRLRACMLCSLIKSYEQFRNAGCDNCEEILEMRGSGDRVLECTSSDFTGMVANVDPSQSWAARWQRIDKYTTGIYAIQVIGRLPEDVIDTLRGRGLTYIPRDGGQVAVDE